MKVFALILSLPFLGTKVEAATATNCGEQWGCFDFSIREITSAANEIQCSGLGNCGVEICMHIDVFKEGCIKDGDGISHACDASDINGCAYSADDTSPVFDVGEFGQSCPEIIGRGGAAGTSKCQFAQNTTFCQEALPGDTVYFILKDASSKNNINENDVPFFDGNNCNATISCSNNQYSCGGNDNQIIFERVWAYTIPETSVCGYCPTPPPTTSPPPTPPPTTSPPTPQPTPTSPPTPQPTVKNTEIGTPAPSGPKPPSGSQGDPHFKTWQNEHFEYHGQCDMILAKDHTFADGLGLDVQIRTKLVRFWSYIKQAAIRIGGDILEIEGSGDPDADASYWINMEYRGPLKTVGGFPVTVTKKGTLGKWIYEIDLSSKFPGQKIVIATFKEFISVDFVNAKEDAFGNCAGMLGDFNTGLTVARDGMTILDDFSELGNEWQLLPVDNMLFHDISEPQFPKKCIEPEDPRGERRRRLGEAKVSQEQAEAACASLKDPLDRKDCVYDVLATQDLDMVGAF